MSEILLKQGPTRKLESTETKAQYKTNTTKQGQNGPKEIQTKEARTNTQIKTIKLKTLSRPTPGPAHPNQNPKPKKAPTAATAQTTASTGLAVKQNQPRPDVEAGGQTKQTAYSSSDHNKSGFRERTTTTRLRRQNHPTLGTTAKTPGHRPKHHRQTPNSNIHLQNSLKSPKPNRSPAGKRKNTNRGKRTPTPKPSLHRQQGGREVKTRPLDARPIDPRDADRRKIPKTPIPPPP